MDRTESLRRSDFDSLVTVPPDLPGRLAHLLDEHLELSESGIDWPQSRQEYRDDRAQLLAGVGEVQACMMILADAPRTKHHRAGSYKVKHALERILEARGQPGHISNGAAIASALLLGRRVRLDPPNALIDVPLRWLAQLEQSERRKGAIRLLLAALVGDRRLGRKDLPVLARVVGDERGRPLDVRYWW